MLISSVTGFKVLNEPERTAALYALLQHSTQDQIRFFMAVLQQMIRPEEPKAVPGKLDSLLQKQTLNARFYSRF